MKIEPLNTHDLERIRHLQPSDWPDIFPHLEFYLSSNFCYPIKCIMDNTVVGIGATIIHKYTAWLAHIIVDSNHRNKGIGKFITQSLVDSLDRSTCHTILLIATQLGLPVYERIGFEKETEYVFLRDGKTSGNIQADVTPFHVRYQKEIYALDQIVSGENRRQLLEPHLPTAKLIIQNNKLEGLFLPTLGEGLIISCTPEVGNELVNLKHSDGRKASIPQDNKPGIDFLLQHGYQEFYRGIRMRLGKKITWQPDKIYGRIGGNLG